MKSKILITFFTILLTLTLIGCNGMVAPGLPEWMKAENKVYNYWRAIINRQYELAKFYCITDGIWYNKVDEWEEYINANSEGEASILIFLDKFYGTTEVIGNNAIAYIWIFIDIITLL